MKGRLPWAGALGSALAAVLVAAGFRHGALVYEQMKVVEKVVEGTIIAGYAIFFKANELTVFNFALPVAFGRWAVPGASMHWAKCALIAALVGAAAWLNHKLWTEKQVPGFELLLGVEVASYVLVAPIRYAWLLAPLVGAGVVAVVVKGWTAHALLAASVLCTGFVAWSLAGSFGVTATWLRRFFGVLGLVLGATVVPSAVMRAGPLFLPLAEMSLVFETIEPFLGPDQLRRASLELFIVCANVKIGLGFLGIALLQNVQMRANNILTVGQPGGMLSSVFTRKVVWSAATIAMPYMLYRVIFENILSFNQANFNYKVAISTAVDSFFPQGEQSGEAKQPLLGAIASGNMTVEAYAKSLVTVLEMTYSFVDRKLFSVPKLALLPFVVLSQPRLVMTVLPLSIGLDMTRSYVVSRMTYRIESLRKELLEVRNKRRIMEQHDVKNEELIQREGVGAFVQEKWASLTLEHQRISNRFMALQRVRGYIHWLYTQDFVSPGIECAIAFLMESGYISPIDIYVYIRVIEDTIDFALFRVREQAEIATVLTEIARVKELWVKLQEARERPQANCQVKEFSKALEITGFGYSRGSAVKVQMSNISLAAGKIYAVTGPNGCGKSTFFSILAACGRKGGTLPPGVLLSGEDPGISESPASSQSAQAGEALQYVQGLSLPSNDVVEITQKLYCPLFVTPLQWLLGQAEPLKTLPLWLIGLAQEKIISLSHQLRFHALSGEAAEEEAAGLSLETLHGNLEDWYGQLSGGQRCKAELIRQVFLKEHCPGVLLIDETFAPLDPRSRFEVQLQLKKFCSNSLILVIYHVDAHETCVAGPFFDGNLHFENGTAQLLPTCEETHPQEEGSSAASAERESGSLADANRTAGGPSRSGSVQVPL